MTNTNGTQFNPAAESTKPGWEKRYLEFSTDDFTVTIAYNGDKLTDDEYSRTRLKLDIIEEYAAELALQMLKGSVKYYSDDRSPEEWRAFEDEEQNDIANYRLLRRTAERKEAGRAKWTPPSDMQEIARRNGFRLEGDRLIQTGF